MIVEKTILRNFPSPVPQSGHPIWADLHTPYGKVRIDNPYLGIHPQILDLTHQIQTAISYNAGIKVRSLFQQTQNRLRREQSWLISPSTGRLSDHGHQVLEARLARHEEYQKASKRARGFSLIAAHNGAFIDSRIFHFE